MHMYQQLFFLLVFTGVTAAIDNLTGSLCGTCTPICSTPPPTTKPPPSPPTVTSKPPPSPPTVTFKPLPSPPTAPSRPPLSLTPVHNAPPPPRFYYFDSPISGTPPPPTYVSSGGDTNNRGPAPPRFVYFPSTQPAGGAIGPNGYPYPYYMYDSKGACCYVGVLWVLTLLVCICCVIIM